jgi:Ser/Thr protein kinase RdoA (MazF antagonist)
MGDPSAIGPEAAASLLAHVTGKPFQLLRRLAGGETGAHEFLRGDGQPVVVKWDSRPRSRQLRGEAVALSERLRTVGGWPVPAQSVVDAEDVRFVIQEFMPGSPPEHFDHQLVDRLLELHSRRLGLARPTDPVHWPTALIQTLTVGGEGYCLHSSLRDFGGRTRSLVERVEAFGTTIDESALVGRDIVHWDLHGGNLLVADGALSAVVDTDFSVVGDASFDLVTLALSSLTLPCEAGVRSRLFGSAFDELDDLKAQSYLAHLFIRILDWPIRRGQFDEVDFWLARADELLKI